MRRDDLLQELRDTRFDVAVVGGGINGACLYHHLCASGFRTLLIDRGDFACGTSQSSAMMIWGGLLYLATLDFSTVLQLCRSRDRMIQRSQFAVHPAKFRYVSSRHGGRNRALVQAALYLYWLMGAGRRRLPQRLRNFPEASFLKPGEFPEAQDYEEARVAHSDARFVLQWILAHRNEGQAPLNYCELLAAAYDVSAKSWRLEISDRLGGRDLIASARTVINAAGVWTDRLNALCGIETPYRHIFGKGVFIGIDRIPGHELPLIVDSGPRNETLSLIPWGPVSLWGPTETTVQDPEDGLVASPEDIRFLLDQINAHVREPVSPAQIVSLRCGVRPLAVDRNYRPGQHTLGISRGHRIWEDRDRPWISVFGGKITNCVPLALSVVRKLETPVRPPRPPTPIASTVFEAYPGLETPVPSAAWCAEHEMACTLEDYLRRRTNISQWLPRGGLGRNDEHIAHLAKLAAVFGETADAYAKKVRTQFDEIICAV